MRRFSPLKMVSPYLSCAVGLYVRVMNENLRTCCFTSLSRPTSVKDAYPLVSILLKAFCTVKQQACSARKLHEASDQKEFERSKHDLFEFTMAPTTEEGKLAEHLQKMLPL
jgi:hypothetical protein